MQDSEDQPFSVNLLATVQLVGARDRLSERELLDILQKRFEKWYRWHDCQWVLKNETVMKP